MDLKRITVLSAAIALASCATFPHAARAGRAPAAEHHVSDSDELRLAAIFEADAAREDDLDPLSRLFRGESVEPEALRAIYTDRLDRMRLNTARRSLYDIARVNRERLSAESRISYDVFVRTKREEVTWLRPDLRALTGVRPFNHFGGLHVEFPSLMSGDGSVPFRDEADYRRALELDAAFPTVIDNAILRFREGMASGVVEPKLTVRNMIGQIEALLTSPVEESPFYWPVRDMPATIEGTERESLQQDFAETIRTQVYPAYRRLRAFLADEYLPAARESVGLSDMKGGEELYRKLIERETTLALDPDAVHRLGLSEVERIRSQMQAVSRELGFDGPLAEFFVQVRTDPRFHPKTEQELVNGFAAVSRKVDSQVPRYFSTRPKTGLQISTYPDFRARYEPGAGYYQGSADGSRPGTFFFNTYDLPSRFLSSMTTLYLHEAVPGHHFQISLAQENTALPDFQRFSGNNAFIEGWALYAETLGYPMGLYDDPIQHWGTLDDEMLRAMRLVVDTGLHANGWSREQAIEFMLANSGMARTDATAEVERYIANPAQALSYKIGSLTIQNLRRKAQEALSGKFDIRAFHDQVLGSGALPLPILEAKIDRWIEAEGIE